MNIRKKLLTSAISACTALTLGGAAQGQVVVDPPIIIDPPIVIGPPIVIDPPIILPEWYDSKTVAGNACQALYGTQVASLRHYPSYLYNAGTGTIRVVCPIVRDNTVNTNGTWSVNVYGYNVGGTYSCYLYSYTTHGVWQESKVASSVAVGKVTLNLDVNKSSNMGFYSLYCSIPKNSRLYSYKYTEPLRTDRNS